MSIEPEDALEEALRSDLPSQETEARLRRRMLAAGLAVGNGVAATTAAAAASGATGAAVAKAATFSWGLKVGLAATLAVSGVGLAWEHGEQASVERLARRAPPAVASAVEARPVVTSSPLGAVNEEAEPPAAAEVATAAPRRDVPPREASSERAPATSPVAAAPSAAEFAESEPQALGEPQKSTLSEETQLLDRAFAELAAGNRDAAARLVREHEVRYPRGLLSKERERAKLRIAELSRGE